jgi:pilus assembly protein CpaF
VRGRETLDMLQAMNTGHEGSLTTVHANGPRDALSRLETLVLMTGLEIPLRAIREQIASALDVVVHLTRLVDGSRRVASITEVVGMESDVVTLQELFAARPPAGRAHDHGMSLLQPLRWNGLQPHFQYKLSARGVAMPDSFDEVESPAEVSLIGGGR